MFIPTKLHDTFSLSPLVIFNIIFIKSVDRISASLHASVLKLLCTQASPPKGSSEEEPGTVLLPKYSSSRQHCVCVCVCVLFWSTLCVSPPVTLASSATQQKHWTPRHAARKELDYGNWQWASPIPREKVLFLLTETGIKQIKGLA